jgi:hypothetical protein
MGLSPPGIYLKGWCRLFEHRLRGDDFGFIEDVRQRHAELASQVKRQFKFIKSESLPAGAPGQRRRGTRARRHHRGRDRPARRVMRPTNTSTGGAIGRCARCRCVFLLDMSASTDFPVPDPEGAAVHPGLPNRRRRPTASSSTPSGTTTKRPKNRGPKRRVIDVAKESLALMSEALETLGDALRHLRLLGLRPQDVEFHVAKEFNDRLSSRSWAAMAAMQPRRSTRMGPAIRHALAKLDREGARMKVLIVVSDGYPQDCDYGPDRNDDEYGIQDTAPRCARPSARACRPSA